MSVVKKCRCVLANANLKYVLYRHRLAMTKTITDELLRSFARVDVCNVTLLGADLFHGHELDKTWSSCCSDLARAVEKLSDTGCQDALILLRSSFSAPM